MEEQVWSQAFHSVQKCFFLYFLGKGQLVTVENRIADGTISWMTKQAFCIAPCTFPPPAQDQCLLFLSHSSHFKQSHFHLQTLFKSSFKLYILIFTYLILEYLVIRIFCVHVLYCKPFWIHVKIRMWLFLFNHHDRIRELGNADDTGQLLQLICLPFPFAPGLAILVFLHYSK